MILNCVLMCGIILLLFFLFNELLSTIKSLIIFKFELFYATIKLISIYITFNTLPIQYNSFLLLQNFIKSELHLDIFPVSVLTIIEPDLLFHSHILSIRPSLRLQSLLDEKQAIPDVHNSIAITIVNKTTAPQEQTKKFIHNDITIMLSSKNVFQQVM